ncbi:hypothetical protein LOK74_01970 [Brevibacillus humidisoli]|uniref:hypothetical protein n=1 Tax=Brevibacillus humidisoli TaxID=2895522 RepID=UPI001E56F35E|nr:hypothetical protein [Brevibacillus humidisoli]UFJ41327.1 hypothetical protein LOK74_01970 [Brevibacillus humidisoli]
MEVNPNPILLEPGSRKASVQVTFQNRLPEEHSSEVGWRWEDEDVWYDVQVIDFPGMYVDGGRQTVTFEIPIQSEELRTLAFAIDPNQNTAELNEDDNEIRVPIEYNTPDLRISRIDVTTTSDSLVELLLTIVEERNVPEGEELHTHIRYGYGSYSYGRVPISVIAGGKETVRIQLPRFPGEEVMFVASINKPMEVVEAKPYQENNVTPSHLYLGNNLDLAAISIESPPAYEEEEVTTVVKVANVMGTMDREVDVVLRLNGEEIGREPVHILPDQGKYVSFTWEAPQTGEGKPVTQQLEAEINPEPRELEEVTYNNNVVKATQVILPEFEGKTCPRIANRTSAVSGYYEYYCNCGPTGCSICVGKYHESITVTPIGPTPTPVKAGMGFEYQYVVRYHNDNPNNGDEHGFQEVEAGFDEDQDLPTVGLVPTLPTPQAFETWSMPRAKIQRGQGDLEMIEYIPTLQQLQLNESEHVDGGNQYYTSFYQKDGMYPFSVTGRRAGVREITYTDINGITSIQRSTSPRLTVCTPGMYEIEGSPHDDYIFRRVDPNNPYPFDTEPGWDWKGKRHVFDEIAPFWNSYGKENPFLDTYSLNITESSWY